MSAPKYTGRNTKVFFKQRMSRRAVLLLVGGAGGLALVGGAVKIASSPAEARGKVTLYRDPECSCCKAYADYLHSNGFEVDILPTHDLELLDDKYGIATDLRPCHLSLIGGYVVGGHVPINAVNRLLLEKPQITGITLPGMPTGAPGMPGEKSGPLQVYEIAKGPRKVYAVV
jgi:hypothetical protein